MYFHISPKTLAKIIRTKQMLQATTNQTIRLDSDDFIPEFLESCARTNSPALHKEAEEIWRSLMFDNGMSSKKEKLLRHYHDQMLNQMSANVA